VEAGAAIVLASCNESDAQQWKRVAVPGNYVHYVNKLSGMCLDARGTAVNGIPGPAVDLRQHHQRKLGLRASRGRNHAIGVLADLGYQNFLP